MQNAVQLFALSARNPPHTSDNSGWSAFTFYIKVNFLAINSDFFHITNEIALGLLIAENPVLSRKFDSNHPGISLCSEGSN